MIKTNNIQEQLTECISRMEYGAVFSLYDFLSYGSYDTVKRTMHRIGKDGKVERVMNGLYWKPVPTGDPPDMRKVASAIAKKFSWSITPSRAHCLFVLGLRVKDDKSLSFMSTGPARSYQVMGKTITFHHTLTKDIAGISEKSGIVVEALRAVGKANITVKTLRIIREHLSLREMETMRRECTKVTNWIYDAIVTMTCLDD